MSFTNTQTPELLYYDIVITNLETTTAEPPIVYFNETRNNPFVYEPEEYLMSIIRFTLDTPTLPIFIPEIKPFQSNVNASIYSFTFEYTDPISGVVFTQHQFVEYATQDKFAVVPNPPSLTVNGLQNNATGYYYIYNYQYWIFLLNQTLALCLTNLNAQLTTAGVTIPTTNDPYLSWDTSSQTAILVVDQTAFDDTQPNYIKFFFNAPLYQLFSSFPAILNSVAFGVNGENVRIITASFGGSTLIDVPSNNPTYTGLQIFQEYSTVALWTPITSIVFCSNTLPIVPNQLSTPLLFINGQIINNNGNNSNIAQIITDFVSETGIYKPNIVYNPSAQFRFIELLGNRPLYNLDVTVYWKDRTGSLNPFRLSSGSSATIKFLFQKKTAFIDTRKYKI